MLQFQILEDICFLFWILKQWMMKGLLPWTECSLLLKCFRRGLYNTVYFCKEITDVFKSYFPLIRSCPRWPWVELFSAKINKRGRSLMTSLEDGPPGSPCKHCEVLLKGQERLQPCKKEQGRSCVASTRMPLWLAGSGSQTECRIWGHFMVSS